MIPCSARDLFEGRGSMKRILLAALAVLMCLIPTGCKESDNLIIDFESSEKRLFLNDRKELGARLANIAFDALVEDEHTNPATSPLTYYTLFEKKSKEQTDVLTSYMEKLGYSEDSFITPSYAFYIKKDRVLKEEPLNGYALYPSATVFLTDPETSSASRINRFIKNATSSDISTVLDTKDKTVSPNYAVISTLGFTGKWAKQYESSNVKDGIFTDKDGLEQKVKYLCSYESYYIECGGGYGIRKSYKGGDFDFVALLPPEGMSVESYVRSLTAEQFCDAFLNPHFTTVNTRIPKFTATLVNELSDKRELPVIASEKAEYYFETVIFSVAENGTKGASVTTASVNTTPNEEDPETVVLNRPFFYAVVDKNTGAPLIAGIINHVE